MSQPMANFSTNRVDTVRTGITRDNLGRLDFLANHGFTPSQRLVLTKHED